MSQLGPSLRRLGGHPGDLGYWRNHLCPNASQGCPREANIFQTGLVAQWLCLWKGGRSPISPPRRSPTDYRFAALLGRSWGRLGALVGPSWCLLGGLETILRPQEPIRSESARRQNIVKPFQFLNGFCSLGGILGASVATWSRLWAVLEPLGPLGRMLEIRSWGFLEPSWVPSGPS